MEVNTVKVRKSVFSKLGVSNEVGPQSEVTILFPNLLYVLSDPNAIEIVYTVKIKATSGETKKVNRGKKIKYLVKTDKDDFEQKETPMPVGVILEVTPTLSGHQKISIDVKLEHYAATPPKMIDKQSSLPIGEPMISSKSIRSSVEISSGDTTIIGRVSTIDSMEFTLLRAYIISE